MSSRRKFLAWSTLAPFIARESDAEPTRYEFVREFPGLFLETLSPDGTKMCLFDGRNGQLRVVEVGTWREIWRGLGRLRVPVVHFFSDAQTLFVSYTAPSHAIEIRSLGVDIRTGEESALAVVPGLVLYQPLSDRLLIGTRRENGLPESLEVMEFPSLREIARTTWSAADRLLAVSQDRKLIFTTDDQTLVCRRSESLENLWRREIEMSWRAYGSAFFADGAHVLVSMVHLQAGEAHLSILDARSGSETARLSLSVDTKLSLSRDGKSVAIVTEELDKHHTEFPTATIYSVPSGEKLASIVHDRIKSGRHQFLEGGCTAAFTADDGYLITSGGKTTKIWKCAA